MALLQNKTVIVTGATGFVGSHLLRRLLNEEAQIHTFVRRSSNLWRIDNIKDRLALHEVSLNDTNLLYKTIESIKPDYVFHLATYGGVGGQADNQQIIDTNYLGTVNLLNACNKTGYGGFINTGSSSEYGIKDEPMREEMLPEPYNTYGATKAAATIYCQSQAREKGLPITTLRLFSPFGPYDEPNRLISYVIKSLLKNEEIKLSSKSYVRDYIYIDDVIESYMAVIRQKSYGKVYNIGSNRQHSVEQVFNTAAKILGSSAKPVWGEFRPRINEPKIWIADISKAQNELNWAIKTNFEKGMKETISWMKENLRYYN